MPKSAGTENRCKRTKRNYGGEYSQTLVFEIPSDPTIERVTITEKVVTEGSEPELLRNEDKAAVSINLKQDAKKEASKTKHNFLKYCK